MPPRKKKQAFTEEAAEALLEKSGHFVVTSEHRFHIELSNNLENAWAARGSERPLYTVFSHIISHLCDTIVPPQFPTSTISHTPQALFRVHQPPLGQPARTINMKDLHPDQIPDFARMIFTYRDYQEGLDFGRELVDYWEIKGLNIAQRWDSTEARIGALRAMRQHMEQLWKQSRAAFAHNESWTHTYALLIVGPYFSQVVWERPDGVIIPPVEDVTKSETRNTRALYDNYNARIKEAKARQMPRIEFLNAPVFDFGAAEDGQAQKVSLSEHFLYAVSLPLKEHFADCATQSSWFDPPPEKPSAPVWKSDPQVDATAIVRSGLISDPLNRLQSKKDADFVPLSSSNDSPEDDKDSFEPSPATKRVLKTWQALGSIPFSPAVTRGREPGLRAAVPPAEPEDEDEDIEQDVQKIMVRFRKVGLARPRVNRHEGDEEVEEVEEVYVDDEDEEVEEVYVDDEDEEIYADDEHTESE